MAPPKIKPVPRGRMPSGYIVGRTDSGTGPLQLLDATSLRQLGILKQMPKAGFGFFIEGLQADGELIGAGALGSNVSFLDGDGAITATIPAAALTVMRIVAILAGVPTDVGTITFQAASATGLVEWTGGQYDYVAGTILQLYAPNPADLALSDVTGTVMGFVT